MTELPLLIDQMRSGVTAVMRTFTHVQRRSKKRPPLTEVKVGFVGTAWCLVTERLVFTAYHVLNNGKPRDTADHFYVFTVPSNGPVAYHWPVVNFPFEDSVADMAVLEIGAPSDAGQRMPALPVTFKRPADGARVVTYGFPAPAISQANVRPTGEYAGGGTFFLKGHANEGIVSAQYEGDGQWFYAFNVDWHHGESGGPVVDAEAGAVFAVMQNYRKVQTPEGTYPGPRQGRSLQCVEATLRSFGATVR